MRTIHLIDTPGFNDTTRADVETLSTLASYLGALYTNRIPIDGIVLLHPINDNRMAGSSMRMIEMLKKICGWSSYRNMAVATTMWPPSPPPQDPYSAHRGGSFSQGHLDTAASIRNERELLTNPRFLGNFLAQGATAFRHNEWGWRDAEQESKSARWIIAHLIAQTDARGYTPKALQLQLETVDENKTLGDTEAGADVADDLCKILQEHQRHLNDIQKEIKGQLAQASSRYMGELQELRVEIGENVANAEEGNRALRNTIEDLQHELGCSWEGRLTFQEERYRQEIASKEQELRELEESVRLSRMAAAQSRLSLSSCGEQDYLIQHEIEAKQQDLASTREGHR
ncbi:hypothetical protein BJY04DRAFT_212251 [Aspergillus karnatakaensis]|uniref:uncharacterized protein n=1 Tax=Aspergillus karnatakaensis TaxID=1810916 RepID=UPI003CCD5F24